MRTSSFLFLVASVFAQSTPPPAQNTPPRVESVSSIPEVRLNLTPSPTNLRAIHKVFIDKLPNSLDQHLRAELSRQMSGRIVVTLLKEDADAIITCTTEEDKGTGVKIVSRGLGLHDASITNLDLLDKERKTILWSAEVGDRTLLFGAIGRGSERATAERLVKQLKKSINK